MIKIILQMKNVLSFFGISLLVQQNRQVLSKQQQK